MVSNIYNIFQIILLTIIGLMSILTYIKIPKTSKEEYLISIDSLERTITVYINLVLNKKIELMQDTYDLNPESKVNSIKKFNDDVAKLISDTASEIIRNQISINTRKTLLRYFNMNGLIIYVISFIKTHTI